MAQKMGQTIIPAGSTDPIVVPLPFTPSSVYAKATPEIYDASNCRRSEGLSSDGESLLMFAFQAGIANPVVAVEDLAFSVRETAHQDSEGTIALGDHEFTIEPDTNTCINNVVIHWLAMDY